MTTNFYHVELIHIINLDIMNDLSKKYMFFVNFAPLNTMTESTKAYILLAQGSQIKVISWEKKVIFTRYGACD